MNLEKVKKNLRKDILRAVRIRNGITVNKMLSRAPEELRQDVRETIDQMCSEGALNVDLRGRCTLPVPPSDGPHYTAEVSEKVYLAYCDVIGQFVKCPTYADVTDFLGTQGITPVVYKMTQWWRIALRNSRDGTLIKDIRSDASAKERTWTEAADAALLAALQELQAR